MAMCKEVGACPVPAGEDVDCNCFGCSGFDKDAYASANDGIMTWPELLDKMGNLGDKWQDAIKGWVRTTRSKRLLPGPLFADAS